MTYLCNPFGGLLQFHLGKQYQTKLSIHFTSLCDQCIPTQIQLTENSTTYKKVIMGFVAKQILALIHAFWSNIFIYTKNYILQVRSARN